MVKRVASVRKYLLSIPSRGKKIKLTSHSPQRTHEQRVATIADAQRIQRLIAEKRAAKKR